MTIRKDRESACVARINPIQETMDPHTQTLRQPYLVQALATKGPENMEDTF